MKRWIYLGLIGLLFSLAACSNKNQAEMEEEKLTKNPPGVPTTDGDGNGGSTLDPAVVRTKRGEVRITDYFIATLDSATGVQLDTEKNCVHWVALSKDNQIVDVLEFVQSTNCQSGDSNFLASEEEVKFRLKFEVLDMVYDGVSLVYFKDKSFPLGEMQVIGGQHLELTDLCTNWYSIIESSLGSCYLALSDSGDFDWVYSDEGEGEFIENTQSIASVK